MTVACSAPFHFTTPVAPTPQSMQPSDTIASDDLARTPGPPRNAVTAAAFILTIKFSIYYKTILATLRSLPSPFPVGGVFILFG